MRTETIQYFTEKEEEFVNLLIDIGVKKNVAKVLVFLANVAEASSRAIERGTDTRQPDVSIATNYLIERGWVQIRAISRDNRGRPKKVYSLAMPMKEIVKSIEEEKKNEARSRLALLGKLRDHVR